MLIDLFISFFKIGLFSIGGGMATIPLIKEIIVEGHGWLTASEFIDLLTIAEMTPGPIAINGATFVGLRIAGFKGALIATLGCISPSCIIVSLLAYVYFKFKNLKIIQGILSGLRPAIVALIFSAGLSILLLALFTNNTLDYISLFLFISSLFILRKFKLNPIFIILFTGFTYLILNI